MTWKTDYEIPKIEDLNKVIIKLITPTITITKETHQKINQLNKKYPNLEWMAGLIGTKNNKEYTINEIIIPEQEVTQTSVEATKNGKKQLANTTNLIGWIHSHNTMKSFQSTTDYDTAHNYGITITTNNNLEYTGITKEKITINNTEIELFTEPNIQIETEEYNNQDIEKQANQLIKEKVYKYEPQTTLTNNTPQEICTACGRKIKKNKMTWCEECGAPYHQKCAEKTEECISCIKLAEIQTERSPITFEKGGYYYE